MSEKGVRILGKANWPSMKVLSVDNIFNISKEEDWIVYLDKIKNFYYKHITIERN